MFAIINTPAPSLRSLRPEATADFDRLIASCLEKDRGRRPASAAAVAEALRRLPANDSGDPSPALARGMIRGIAVLPFRNVSQDPAQEYFADGMTEAVISDLARIKALRVISRTSAMKYKGTALSLPDIARQLNVEAILEGSAHLVGERVRLSVQLIAARTDETLWAERYDRQLEDVLDLQSKLAERVAREIAVQLTPAEVTQLARRHVVNPEAQLEYLKGRHSAWGGSPEGVDLGLRHVKRALEIDPDFAPAWSALADCHIIRATRGMAPPAEAAAEATAAARRALQLDPSLADAHVSIGVVQIHTGDLQGGIRSLRHAIELNPALALAHNMLARALSSFEKHEEALVAARDGTAVVGRHCRPVVRACASRGCSR
jgi:adenylate cyclase